MQAPHGLLGRRSPVTERAGGRRQPGCQGRTEKGEEHKRSTAWASGRTGAAPAGAARSRTRCRSTVCRRSRACRGRRRRSARARPRAGRTRRPPARRRPARCAGCRRWRRAPPRRRSSRLRAPRTLDGCRAVPRRRREHKSLASGAQDRISSRTGFAPQGQALQSCLSWVPGVRPHDPAS